MTETFKPSARSENEIRVCEDINKIAINNMHGKIRRGLSDDKNQQIPILFIDIDETLFHTVEKLVKVINRGARIWGFNEDLPDEALIIENGGTHHYASIFGMTDDEWESWMIEIRRRQYVNEKAKLYFPKAPELLTDLGVTGYISARPATLATFISTQRDLFNRRNFPERPVVLRPETIHIRESSNWKSELIFNEFGHYVYSGARIILIDDSINTAMAVAKINRGHGRNVINQILYRGPFTKGVLDSGSYVPNEEEGIYVSDWENMKNTFDKIKNT